MALSTQGYKGTRDFYPSDMRFRRWMFGKLRHTVESFGFEEYDGPLLESFELYAAKSGEEIVNQQLYSFTDRGERRVAIRPEMTPTLARLVAARLHELPRPIRWYSLPNLWRYERPQRGRLREHWQLNVDILGGETLWADLEILLLATQMMHGFGGQSLFSIHVNNRRLMDFIFINKLGLDVKGALAVTKAVDARPKIGEASYLEMLAKAGLAPDKIATLEKFFSSDLNEVCRDFPGPGAEELQKLFALAEGTALSKSLKFDSKIMRGLDYYTGTVFEMYDQSTENPRAMFGGGRYDNLVGLFGKDTLSGVGFGMGDVTLQNYLETHKLVPELRPPTDVLVAILDTFYVGHANQIAAGLRAEGLHVCTSLQTGKIGNLIKLAEKHQARWFLLFGENELAQKSVALKDLKTGTQVNFGQDEFAVMAQHIKRGG